MISIVFCREEGCSNFIRLTEDVSPKVSYLCANHHRLPRKYREDELQFDTSCSRNTRPSGTEDDNFDPGAEVNQER
jgi:hypothetical protein